MPSQTAPHRSGACETMHASGKGTTLAVAAFCVLFASACIVYGSGHCRFLRSDDLTWIRAVEYKPFLTMCAEQFRHGSPNDYRPVTSVALWIEANAFGDTAPPYYAVNFALHAINALLVGWLATRCGVSQLWAGFIAFVFLLNPAPFRTIVWVSDIATILSTTFMLVAAHLWLEYRETNSTAIYVAAATAAVAAMFTKESGVIAIALLPCADFLFARGRRRVSALAWTYAPLAAAVIIYLTLSLQQIPGWREYPNVYHIGWRMIPNAAYTIGFAVVPVTRVAFGILVGLALLCVTASFAADRIGSFLAAWMLLAALPTAPFAPGGFETTGRYTYSLLAPVSIAIGILFGHASRVFSRPRRAIFARPATALTGAVMLLLFMAVVTHGRAQTPYTTRPGVILYHYAVMSLMGYARSEAFLAAEFPCSSPEQVRAAYQWSANFITDRGSRSEFLLPGLLVRAITDTLVGNVGAAEPDFQRAADLSANGHVELVRGATVSPQRVRMLRSRWRSLPDCRAVSAVPVE